MLGAGQGGPGKRKVNHGENSRIRGPRKTTPGPRSSRSIPAWSPTRRSRSGQDQEEVGSFESMALEEAELMDSASSLLCDSRCPAIITLLWTWVFPFGSWGPLIPAFLPRDCEEEMSVLALESGLHLQG